MTSPLEQRIGYTFRDGGLLKLALTHPSVINTPSNQRLEFLGDAILGAVIARLLYDTYPEEKEGELARRHAALVRGQTLSQLARDIALGDALIIGASEVQSQGHDNDSNLEDALEALIGAIYLDGGMHAVEAFMLPRWKKLAENMAAVPKDAKTALQEWAQARGLPIPTYRIAETSGPSHAPQFTIEVTVKGYPSAKATAANKRTAEQAAAGQLLARLS